MTLFDPLDYDAAVERRDTGMGHAALGAAPSWSTAAHNAIVRLPAGTDFLAEEIRATLDAAGLVTRNRKALGPVIQDARRSGLIVSIGTGRARTSNLSPKVLWRRTTLPGSIIDA